MIGTLLDGRYRILRVLGAGAMGEVYLAEHINLGRKEAVKILHPALARDPQFVARFRREARATNRVHHPNIVAVHDFGQLPDGRFYLAMEYAEGDPVDALLHRGAFSLGRALHVLVQLAEAVHAAHACGVVHRDLKPSNLVLVTHRGQADVLKVLDFGIAKIIAPDHQDSVASQADAVFGTPAYMSPERFHGDTTDPRSDLYAIGCIAHELLTGEPPFGGTSFELMHAHLHRPAPPLRRALPDAPPQLEAIVARLLEKDANRRFATGKELALELAGVPGYRARGGSSGRRRRLVSVLQAAVPGDFEQPLDTLERGPAADATRSPTEELSADVALGQRRDATRALAEALIDAGANDISLVVGLAQWNELAGELDRMDAADDARSARTASAEQAGREREAALRFALGELRYERAQAAGRGEVALSDLDRQIAQLETRLANAAAETNRELEKITDEGIDAATRRDDLEGQLETTSRSLERIVDEIAPRYHLDRDITRLGARLANARSLVVRR